MRLEENVLTPEAGDETVKVFEENNNLVPERVISRPLWARPFSWWGMSMAGAVAIIIGLGTLALIYLLGEPIAMLIFSITIANAMAPVADFFAKKMPRSYAVVLSFLLVIAIILALAGMVVPTLVNQFGQLLAQVPQWVGIINEQLGQLEWLDLNVLTRELTSTITTITGRLLSVPMRVFNGLFTVLMILFVALYWLLAMPKMKAFFLSLFADSEKNEVNSILTEMGRAMGGFMRGSAINGAAVAVLTYIGLLIIGVPFPLVLSIVAGLLEIIPTIGPVIATVTYSLVAFFVSPTTALITLVFGFAVQQLENNILVPFIMRSQTDMPSLLVLIAVIAGGAIGGVMGALVAIPLMAALFVFSKRVLAPALRQANQRRAEESAGS